MLVRVLSLPLLLVLTFALTACADTSAPAADTVRDLDVTAFAERVEARGTVLLDVRTPAEFEEARLPGALLVDASAPDFEQRISELDPDVPYAVYCRSGNRSAAATERMAAAGFTDLAHLDGGITAWVAEGGEVVTD